MPERTQHAPGTPSWVDLQTTDQAGAKSFYTALFGWDYDDQDMGDGAVYSLAQKNGKDVAGVGPLPMPGVPPH
jgi:predicted enzyme related to lactoylglutathione lyase